MTTMMNFTSDCELDSFMESTSSVIDPTAAMWTDMPNVPLVSDTEFFSCLNELNSFKSELFDDDDDLGALSLASSSSSILNGDFNDNDFTGDFNDTFTNDFWKDPRARMLVKVPKTPLERVLLNDVHMSSVNHTTTTKNRNVAAATPTTSTLSPSLSSEDFLANTMTSPSSFFNFPEAPVVKTEPAQIKLETPRDSDEEAEDPKWSQIDSKLMKFLNCIDEQFYFDEKAFDSLLVRDEPEPESDMEIEHLEPMIVDPPAKRRKVTKASARKTVKKRTPSPVEEEGTVSDDNTRDSLVYNTILDHCYFNNRQPGTLILDTPTDSEEEIDVVSVNDGTPTAYTPSKAYKSAFDTFAQLTPPHSTYEPTAKSNMPTKPTSYQRRKLERSVADVFQHPPAASRCSNKNQTTTTNHTILANVNTFTYQQKLFTLPENKRIRTRLPVVHATTAGGNTTVNHIQDKCNYYNTDEPENGRGKKRGRGPAAATSKPKKPLTKATQKRTNKKQQMRVVESPPPMPDTSNRRRKICPCESLPRGSIVINCDCVKRRQHNRMEQRRRYIMRDYFADLVKSIPEEKLSRNAKLAKVRVLVNAKIYINHLNEEDRALQEQKAAMRQEQEQLRARLSYLRRCVAVASNKVAH